MKKNQFPLISVIVLTYNSAEYVRTTLESVLNQDYPGPLELIIGDDCSQDSTVAVCQEWINQHACRFTRTEILVPQENQGVVGNYNTCIKAAQGEWIKGIAGDDVLLPDALSTFYNTAMEEPGKRLFLYSSLLQFQNDDQLAHPEQLKLLMGGPKNATLDINYIFRKPNFWTNAPSFFIAKRVLEDIGYIPRLFRNVEDRPLFSKILASGYSIYHLAKPTVCYRTHQASLTTAMAGARYAECNWKTYTELLRPCFKGARRTLLDLQMLPQYFIIRQGGKTRTAKFLRLVCRMLWALLMVVAFPFILRPVKLKNVNILSDNTNLPVTRTGNNLPFISVLIPVYNAGHYLKTCLDSLAAQTCPDIEFICVNDGSTDNSGKELDLKANQDSRFRIIHQPNGGYGKAMNAALQAARGIYIGIVEPDDWIAPSMYHHLTSLAQRDKADIVKGNYYSEAGTNSKLIEKLGDSPNEVTLTPAELPEYIAGPPSIWSAIYNREWLMQKGIRFSETPGAAFQDLGFCIRTWLTARSITTSHRAFYHYKEDNPNSSSRKMEDGAWAAFQELQLLSEVFSAIPEEETFIRSHVVFRIFSTLRADYRLRIRNTVRSFLLKYSHMLNDYFPLNTLQQDVFTKDEWFDIQLIYNNPLQFQRKSRTRANMLQRLCSVRTEAGKRVVRILGFSFIWR